MAAATVGLLLTLLIIIALVAAIVSAIQLPYSVALVVVSGAMAFVPGVPNLALSPETPPQN